MAHNLIQVNHEQLTEISDQLTAKAEDVERVLSLLDNPFNDLRGGEWTGEAADKFFDEYENEIRPGLERLAQALISSGTLLAKIQTDMLQTEEEGAQQVLNGSADGGRGEGAGGADGANGDVTDAENADDSDAPLRSREEMEAAAEDVFSEEYMEDFIGHHVPVQEGREGELNTLMEGLVNNEFEGAELENALNEIAEIRGVDPVTFSEDYDRYTQLRATIGDEFSDIDLDRHPDFLGSTASLRYGQVAGDVLGVDPVFGSLLSPTGGLVGGGNNAFEPGDNDAVGYHGIFHDAAGHLYNKFDGLGPSYEYLGHEGALPSSHSFSGQLAGFQWWFDQPGLSNETSLANSLIALASMDPGQAQAIAGGINSGFDISQYYVEAGVDNIQADGNAYIDERQSEFNNSVDTVQNGSNFLIDQIQSTQDPVSSFIIDMGQRGGNEFVDLTQSGFTSGVDLAQDQGNALIDWGQNQISGKIEGVQDIVNNPLGSAHESGVLQAILYADQHVGDIRQGAGEVIDIAGDVADFSEDVTSLPQRGVEEVWGWITD